MLLMENQCMQLRPVCLTHTGDLSYIHYQVHYLFRVPGDQLGIYGANG